jgi:hypothetical protein
VKTKLGISVPLQSKNLKYLVKFNYHRDKKVYFDKLFGPIVNESVNMVTNGLESFN